MRPLPLFYLVFGLLLVIGQPLTDLRADRCECDGSVAATQAIQPNDTDEVNGHAGHGCCDPVSDRDIDPRSSSDSEDESPENRNGCECPMPCCSGIVKCPTAMPMTATATRPAASAVLVALPVQMDRSPPHLSGLKRPPKPAMAV